MPEEEVLAKEEVEIPPYKFSHIPKTMLQRDSYWRTYLNVAPEETLSQFEQAAAMQDVGARLQASAIREREAQGMILEGMKRESQYKEVVELKLSLSNMTRLNETLSKEQGAKAKAFQKKQDELKQNFQAVSEECGKLSGLNAELKKRLDEADQTQAMVIDSGSTKEAEDRLQDLQSQVDTLTKEKATLEVKLQDQVVLQREIEGLKRQKAQMQGRLKEEDTRKVQILDLRSQVDALKQQRAELQTQHQSIEAGLRAELAQVSIVAKMVPVVKDNHTWKVEQLKVELTAAYGQQKRLKMQCEDQAFKIEKLRRLVWEMDRKTPPSYSLMHVYEHQWYILFSLVGIEGTGQQLSQNSFERLWKIAGLDDNAQNLVAEMILRGDILVPELAKKMFSLFGHLGYRSLKYWL